MNGNERNCLFFNDFFNDKIKVFFFYSDEQEEVF